MCAVVHDLIAFLKIFHDFIVGGLEQLDLIFDDKVADALVGALKLGKHFLSRKVHNLFSFRDGFWQIGGRIS